MVAKSHFLCYFKNEFACWSRKVYDTKNDKSDDTIEYDAKKLRKC